MNKNDTSPKILVIIVTWNKKKYVLDLIDAIGGLDYPQKSIDILVVDNASKDGTGDAIAAAYPHVKLICNSENLGGTGGFNTGLKWAFKQPQKSYDYLWLLDNDVLVHKRALIELVELMENKKNIGVAGSTMMQLDFPWRINEMGAFVNQTYGGLILNRHMEEIIPWKGYPIRDLLSNNADLTKYLMHCREYMDIDYVAAASILVRMEVAKTAGLWKDYFLHYDDVDWCLRIAKMGKRVVVSAKSLIWHLSAAAKFPTWVLYYDNRNLLYISRDCGVNQKNMLQTFRNITKDAVFHAAIGKPELGKLLLDAIDDFLAGRMGKKNIKIPFSYTENAKADKIFNDPAIRKILIPWTINLQATGIQEALIQARLKRPELQIHFLTLPGGTQVYQFPGASFADFPVERKDRWATYRRMRGNYDLVLQSDYEPILGLSWLNSDIMFINDNEHYRRPPAKIGDVMEVYYSSKYQSVRATFEYSTFEDEMNRLIDFCKKFNFLND